MKLKNLKTKYIARSAIYYAEIDSTQKEVYRRIDENKIANGTVIYADIQTDAIGTHGRRWYTDEGKNIAFSIFVELNSTLDALSGLTLEIAKIIVEVLKEKYGVELSIKEPNDIYFKDKKVGGILTEIRTCNEKAKYLIVGIGLNTNKQMFPEEISLIATSILKEFGIKIEIQEFIVEFCNRFENELNRRLKK